MANLRNSRKGLLFAFDDGDISDDEFFLLYDMNRSTDDYPYWNDERFELDRLDDAESWAQFRFFKPDVYRLQEVLRIPDTTSTYNRMRVDGVEALCIFLKRFAYPCRYVDLIPHFGRAVPDYSIISTQVMDHINSTFSHLLSEFNLPILTCYFNQFWDYFTKYMNTLI